MLFIWARALVFAHLNGLPLIVSRWSHIKLGPFLRREKHRRVYWGYFKNLYPIHWLRKLFILWTYDSVVEPEIAPLPLDYQDQLRKLYVFCQIPHWSDYFKDIRNHRDYIRSTLYSMLSEPHQNQLSRLKSPIIGIHVRKGDFRELRPHEDFAKVGLVRTPLSYFIDLINSVRLIHGTTLPVTVFSDGYDHELEELLDMPNVCRSDANSDIVDLLLLSKSKLLIASAGSTFSYWAAFLSDAPVLLHPDHIWSTIRCEAINRAFFEGGVRGPTDTWPDLLKQNIKDIEGKVQ